jgi:putative transposase
MSLSFSQVILHIVISTKDRKDCLPKGIRSQLFSNISQSLRQKSIMAYKVGGVGDHFHIACSLPKGLSVDELIDFVKNSSEQWLNEQEVVDGPFAWHEGYGAFSIANSQLDMLAQYIEQQEEYHQDVSFDEEFKQFLDLYDIE